MSFRIDKRYKYHYIRVNKKSPIREVVARVDVSNWNKKGVTSVWDEIDKKFPNNAYISCLESTNEELRCFEPGPNFQ